MCIRCIMCNIHSFGGIKLSTDCKLQARLNLLLSTQDKENLKKIANMNGISINKLLNQTIKKLIIENKTTLDKYNEFLNELGSSEISYLNSSNTIPNNYRISIPK